MNRRGAWGATGAQKRAYLLYGEGCDLPPLKQRVIIIG